MPSPDEILLAIKESCTHAVPVLDEKAKPLAVGLAREDLFPVAKNLLENPLLFFDMLSCITGLDNGPEAGTMEVIYNVYSIPLDHHLMLKVILPREHASIDSVCGIWKTANWHEREIFDLYGIHFKNHPDLRRILLPEDWEGHPLRKDYTHQDYYRDVKVKY